jgi:hypothetical protein
MTENASVLESDAVAQLVIEIEESMRATEDAVKRFVPPTDNALPRAVSRQHHLVFGRRGSGKSSLLRKAMNDLSLDRRPVAYIDLEVFKDHSYPDVLLSILIKIFDEYEKWLKSIAISSATRTSFWNKFGFGVRPSRPPFNKQEAITLAEDIHSCIKKLTNKLYSEDNIDINATTRRELEVTDQSEIGVQIGSPVSISGKIGSNQRVNGSQELQETYRQSKINYLYAHIIEYQNIFDRMSSLSNGASYLFLDDLYQIRRPDQAKVIDYCHRLAKGHNLWLKIGTVRHRTQAYINGNPPIGIKVGDDVEVIDLDLTLENFVLTRKFLIQILLKFISNNDLLTIKTLLAEQAVDRLVLASGGVTRDFLGIFRRSVDAARTRIAKRGEVLRGARIAIEDVNTAAGSYDQTKRQELIKDANDNHEKLERQFQELTTFCLDVLNNNVFIIDEKDEGEWVELIQELVDLRLLHRIKSHFSMKYGKYARRRFDAYMIDLSQYARTRMKEGFGDKKFWEPDNEDLLRDRTSFIYTHDKMKRVISKDTKTVPIVQKEEKPDVSLWDGIDL